MKELTAYVIDGHELLIRPAPLERDWMDASDQRFAYRCLPLNIANAHGWEILCPTGFSALWDGRKSADAIRIKCKTGNAPAISHFGEGILTFHVPCVFRTDPGVDMFATGPINRPKDAIAPLTGIVETDWSPYTFTMNWQFTRAAQRVYFEEGEPFCHVFPVARRELESLDPRMARLSENPELEAEHKHGRPAASNSMPRCPLRSPRRRGRSGRRPIFEGSIRPAMMRPATIEASSGWRLSRSSPGIVRQDGQH